MKGKSALSCSPWRHTTSVWYTAFNFYCRWRMSFLKDPSFTECALHFSDSKWRIVEQEHINVDNETYAHRIEVDVEHLQLKIDPLKNLETLDNNHSLIPSQEHVSLTFFPSLFISFLLHCLKWEMQYQTKTNSRRTEYYLVDIILQMVSFLSYQRMCLF